MVIYISLDSLLSTLKPCRLESINHTYVPQLILAGVGTGKTTTITTKIAYMVEKENIDSSQIFTLTNYPDFFESPEKKDRGKNLEKEIDQLVYELYDLTPEEIKTVEGFNRGD